MHNKQVIIAVLVVAVIVRLFMRLKRRQKAAAQAVATPSPSGVPVTLSAVTANQRAPHSSVRNILLIAKREFIERVKTKAFVFMTLLVPGVALLGFGVVYFTATHLQGGTITIASNDPELAQDVRSEMQGKTSQGSGYAVNVVAPAGPADIKQLNRQVSDKSIDGYVWMDVQPGQALPKVQFVSRSSADMVGANRVEEAVQNSLLRERLHQKGISTADTDAMLSHLKVDTLQVKNGVATASDSSQGFFAAYGMMFLLYFSVTYYAMNTARSVVQEKTSRIFEVMLATVKPEETMAGKMLGVGAVGLLQITIWCLTVVPLRIYMMASAAGKDLHISLSITQFVFFAVYFVLGFLLYSSLAAALGATVSAEQEVQQFAFPLVLPMFIAFITYYYILSSPNSAYAVFVSLFPFTAPIAMLLRISALTPPLWQIALSIALMIATIWLVLLVAARIYRVGILMYGKRPTLPELLRWLRYA